MAREKIKPCPFCGSKKCFYDCGENKDEDFVFYMTCGKCGAMGPDAESQTKAKELWNAAKR